MFILWRQFVFIVVFSYVFFFKQKTAYEMRISDWSSDVCSSDLQGMARAVALEMADNGGADQIEVADRIQHLVAHELVVEAQAVLVEDGLAVDHDGVVQRAAASEAHGAHLLDVLRDRKSTRLNSSH